MGFQAYQAFQAFLDFQGLVFRDFLAQAFQGLVVFRANQVTRAFLAIQVFQGFLEIQVYLGSRVFLDLVYQDLAAFQATVVIILAQVDFQDIVAQAAFQAFLANRALAV